MTPGGDATARNWHDVAEGSLLHDLPHVLQAWVELVSAGPAESAPTARISEQPSVP